MAEKWRDLFTVHDAANCFPMMKGPALEALVASVAEAGGVQEPIVFWGGENEPEIPQGEAWTALRKRQYSYELPLLDGRNRLEAAEQTGLPIGHLVSEAKIVFGDPIAYVRRANLDRRHLDAEEKRQSIASLLKLDPSQSDRQIAAAVKSTPTTVGAVRKKLEADGDVSRLDTRRDTKGVQRPARQPSSKPKAAAAGRPPAPHKAAPASDDTRAQFHQPRRACRPRAQIR